MKINKLYIALLVFATTLAMVACDEFEDTEAVSPAVPEGCQGVYFPSTNSSVFELEPTEETQISLTIARVESSGSVEVPITVETNDDDIFVVPSEVSFADGETETSIAITFPDAAEGTTYSLKLAVEGDDYVNPYSSASSYVEASVTRIKWETIDEQMVYVDGTFATLYGVSIYPMYVEAEKAQLGESVRYRFKNAYDVPSTVDEYGIYDGYPYNDEGDFDTSTDYYVVIEIDDPDGVSGNVTMDASDLGVDWGYGMISIGSVYGNLSTDSDSYPLGTLADGVVTFPANSLYFSMADYGTYVASTPTYIYFTKETYIASSLTIDDFNDVEYEEIEGAVSEFESVAYSDSWSQTFAKAIDQDEDNEDSEYKNLYYLPNLYAEGYGLAFYYDEESGSVEVVDEQPIGTTVLGQDLYVSQSDSLESSVEVNAKGVTIYTLGLTFHYEDGTILGQFSELYYYSETAVSYDKADFIGYFTMSGQSQFGSSYPDANMEVTISEGEDDNTLVITGVDYAEEITATFDASTSEMSIAPQVLADYGSYDMTLYTTDSEGYSTTAVIDFTFNMQGNLVITDSSEGDGYLLYSTTLGGWADGYYNLVFTPDYSKSTSVSTHNIVSTFAVHSTDDIVSKETESVSNFKVQGNRMAKKMKTTMPSRVIF